MKKKDKKIKKNEVRKVKLDMCGGGDVSGYLHFANIV